jgi:hypothetical protein
MPAPKGLLDHLLSEAFDTYVHKIVNEAFGDRWGYNDNKPVQEALLAYAVELLRTDPDIKKRILTRLTGLIDRDDGRDKK